MSGARKSVLASVKEQARLLRGERCRAAPWSQQQWWEAFCYLVRSWGRGWVLQLDTAALHESTSCAPVLLWSCCVYRC